MLVVDRPMLDSLVILHERSQKYVSPHHGYESTSRSTLVQHGH